MFSYFGKPRKLFNTAIKQFVAAVALLLLLYRCRRPLHEMLISKRVDLMAAVAAAAVVVLHRIVAGL